MLSLLKDRIDFINFLKTKSVCYLPTERAKVKVLVFALATSQKAVDDAAES